MVPARITWTQPGMATALRVRRQGPEVGAIAAEAVASDTAAVNIALTCDKLENIAASIAGRAVDNLTLRSSCLLRGT